MPTPDGSSGRPRNKADTLYQLISSCYAKYLQHLVSKGSRSAVEEAVHAVSWVHQIAGLQNSSDHPTVHAVMDGARQLLAAPKQKEPITVEDLKKTVEFASSRATLSDIRTVAICLLSFAAFSGLMKWPVSKVKISTSRLHHAEITIKHSKTDQYRDRAVVLMARTGQPTCTVAILERYLSMLGAQLQPNQYPFRNITKTRHGEKLRPGGRMSYSWVRELVLASSRRFSWMYESTASIASERAGLLLLRIVECQIGYLSSMDDETAKDGYVQDSMSSKLSVSRSLGL